jgi:hypothetical protein
MMKQMTLKQLRAVVAETADQPDLMPVVVDIDVHRRAVACVFNLMGCQATGVLDVSDEFGMVTHHPECLVLALRQHDPRGRLWSSVEDEDVNGVSRVPPVHP